MDGIIAPQIVRRKSKTPAVREAIIRDRGLIAGLFPACFAPKRSPKRPLKLGLAEDLVARRREFGWGEWRVRRVLADYCCGFLYLTALAEPGAQRVDLDGNAVEPVSAEHADAAAAVLRRWAERRAARAAA